MIPKVIHYCWFGGNPLPNIAVKCINSWKKYFPDYEIIEWNESNFDLFSCDYCREAYDAKKWAFVSDYARFKILYEHGGVYFDTDVEVIKSMDDILQKGAFIGRERIANAFPAASVINTYPHIQVQALLMSFQMQLLVFLLPYLRTTSYLSQKFPLLGSRNL